MKRAGSLYLWVLIGIAAGALLGVVSPVSAVALKPLGDSFLALIKLLIAPLIFCTVVEGVGGAGGATRLGRVAGRTLVYFEVVSTLALVIGLVVGNLFKPGAALNHPGLILDTAAVDGFTHRAADLTLVGYLQHLIPTTFVDAFTGQGDLLQVLLVAILIGLALSQSGPAAEPFRAVLRSTSHVLFSAIRLVMFLAPLGAGAAMAFTIGKYGAGALRDLLQFVLLFYATCAMFVVVVLGLIASWVGFSIFRYLRYMRAELLTLLGTSSSETVLAPLMQKLEQLGCGKRTVALVVPAGYSFNLDGTNIYMTLATLFVAQALGIELTLTEQLAIIGIAMLTSKGAAGVSGSGFVTLAATLIAVPKIPVAGLALIFGIDRFMSEARALTNFIGNGVAAIVISRWEGDLDLARLQSELTSETENSR